MKFLGLILAVILISGFVAIEGRSVEKRNVVDDLKARAQVAFTEAKTQFAKFFSSALTQQIALARESFLKGLEQLQGSSDEIIEEGVDALEKYLPSLKGVVASRVDTVTDSLETYISKNTGKFNEVRQLLLENALKALKNLKNRLRSTKSADTVNQIVASVDNVENQVVNDVSAAKSRSIFGLNWNGLKNTVSERLNGLRTRLDESSTYFTSEKVQEQKEKIEESIEKINDADKLSSSEKIQVIKEAVAECDQADEIVTLVEISVEDTTSSSA